VPQENWHLDKKVPIALIVALILQFGAWAWWTSKLDSRLTNIEEAQQHQKTHSERLVRLESSKEEVSRRLDKIEGKLDILIDKLSNSIPRGNNG
jgi:Tfp pilus assembly protein PilO